MRRDSPGVSDPHLHACWRHRRRCDGYGRVLIIRPSYPHHDHASCGAVLQRVANEIVEHPLDPVGIDRHYKVLQLRLQHQPVIQVVLPADHAPGERDEIGWPGGPGSTTRPSAAV
jgi:hypothetical protein